MPNTDNDAKEFQLQLEARGRAQEGAVEAWRSQNQQRLEELRMFKEVGEDELRSLHEETGLVREKIRLRDSINKQNQHKAAFDSLDKIDPTKDLDSQVDKIEYENPLVANDPAFRQAVAHRYTEAANKAQAASRNTEMAVQLARELKTPLVKADNGLYDIDAMARLGQAAQAAEKTPIPPGFVTKEVIQTASGGTDVHYGPPAETKVPEGVMTRFTDINSKIAGNQAEYSQTQKADLVTEFKSLIAERNSILAQNPTLKLASDAPFPPSAQPAPSPSATPATVKLKYNPKTGTLDPK